MKRIIVIAFCIALIGVAGCERSEPPVTPEETMHSVETTAPVIETTSTAPAGESAPAGIHTPHPDGAEHTAILQAARDYLRTTDDLTVHQLKVENGSAVMDVEARPALTGWRTFLALALKGDTWIVTFSADAFDGTPEFRPAWFPEMSAGLLGSIDWKRARTTLQELAAAHAISEADSQSGFSRTDLQCGTPTMARTAGHEWWASCVVSHKSASVDPLVVYMRWRADGTGWETFDCGTGIEPADDPRFPSDVADEL